MEIQAAIITGAATIVAAVITGIFALAARSRHRQSRQPVPPATPRPVPPGSKPSPSQAASRPTSGQSTATASAPSAANGATALSQTTKPRLVPPAQGRPTTGHPGAKHQGEDELPLILTPRRYQGLSPDELTASFLADVQIAAKPGDKFEFTQPEVKQ